MTIRLTAPEGYKILDTLTRQQHSEVVTDDSRRDRYALVPDTTEPMMTETIGG